MNNVAESSAVLAAAGHCHEQTLIALNELDVVYGDRVVYRNRLSACSNCLDLFWKKRVELFIKSRHIFL